MSSRICMFCPNVSKNSFSYLNEVIKSKWIGQGEKVSEFEDMFKSIFKVPFTVAVNNSSSAIRLALDISGIGPGDEVITTPMTCTATNHPILEQFAKPVFADIQYLTGNIDPDDIEHRITEKTKAIICAHWGGYPCDLKEIHKIADKYNLTVIEDASDAIGAVYNNKNIGNISKFTCFSFQAIKQITAGEGGILCTLDKSSFESAIRKRWYGIDRSIRKPNIIGYYDFDVSEVGYGYHMTNINAVIGISNLEEFNKIKKRRREIAVKYREELENIEKLTLFELSSDRESANELFTIHVNDRNRFCKVMKSRGIETSVVHMRNDMYSIFGGLRKDLPILDKFTETYISLPLHNFLIDNEVDYIIKSIKKGW